MQRGTLFKKIIIGVLLVLGITAAAGFLYWNSNKERIVRQKIEQAIAGKTGLYKVDYDEMQLNELDGYLSIRNMVIGYDSTRLKEWQDSAKNLPASFRLTVPSIELEGVKTSKAMLGKELIARRLTVSNPEITVTYNRNGDYASRNLPGSETWREVLKDMSLISVDTIEITGATITSKSPGGLTQAVFYNSYIRLTGFKVDSAHYHAPGRLAFSDQMIFRTDKVDWRESNKWYDYLVSGVSFDSKADRLSISEVEIKPVLDETGFINAVPYQTDRIASTLKNISFTGIDPEKLSDEIIVANSMNIDAVSLNIYRDLTKPRNNKSRIGSYPHQQIKHIPLVFLIKKVNVRNADIAYKEKSDITGKTGTVKFLNSSITLNNLTNDKSSLKKNRHCLVNIQTSFMGSPLSANLVLALGDESGNFSIEGEGGRIAGPALNSLTEPMGPVRIREGDLKKLEFKIKGDNTHATGAVTLLYNGLKLDLLEQGDDGSFNKKRFTSILANKMIDDANPFEGEAIRTAGVNHQRDVTRSFYNLIWKSLLSGINATIGNKRPMKRP